MYTEIHQCVDRFCTLGLSQLLPIFKSNSRQSLTIYGARLHWFYSWKAPFLALSWLPYQVGSALSVPGKSNCSLPAKLPLPSHEMTPSGFMLSLWLHSDAPSFPAVTLSDQGLPGSLGKGRLLKIPINLPFNWPLKLTYLRWNIFDPHIGAFSQCIKLLLGEVMLCIMFRKWIRSPSRMGNRYSNLYDQMMLTQAVCASNIRRASIFCLYLGLQVTEHSIHQPKCGWLSPGLLTEFDIDKSICIFYM